VALSGSSTFVGFGFGAIQAGLFLYEAFQSDAFARLCVAEVMPKVVSEVRDAGGYFTVNVAHFDRIEKARVGPIQIEDPALAADRQRLVQRIVEAQEIATAVPSVDYYVSSGEGSIHRLLAEGLRRKIRNGGPRAVVYAAENHNHAAEILESKVLEEIPEGEHREVQSQVRFLNTVIGKMSGVVDEQERPNLSPITEGSDRAFLVEAFNRILISKVDFEPSFQRGISVLEEKEDLLPFEEAKLYGHNATHALGAYLGAVAGVETIADLREVAGVIPFMRAAFLEESGAALIRKNAGVDRLFTEEGYRDYADDLLRRMTNPFLGDTVARVGRDPLRKLSWDDRLVGTIRVALGQGVHCRRYAVGVAAALATLEPAALRQGYAVTERLEESWKNTPARPEEKQRILPLIEAGALLLRRWKESGLADLEHIFHS
jgi:mannitol-1-phosphate 5-dehydrogenase